MSKFLRITLAASAVALTAAPAAAAPTSVSNGPVTARAQILKPLTLTKVSNMDFGSIVVSANGTATMDTAGNLTCSAGLTCAATGTPAQYNVTGSNNQVVNITKPNVTLTNTTNPGTPLTLVLSGPSQVTLTSSGAPGNNFNLGGSIAIATTTNDGVYTGDLNVTVDYN